MQTRIDYRKVAPGGFEALAALEKFINGCGIDPSLADLVRLRASQLNGCAYCLDVHAREATARGEHPERLHTLAAWQESPFFTERERAALEWTEAVTLVSENHLPDALYERVRKHFDEAYLVHLTLLITTINAWNRLAISFRTLPVRSKAAEQVVVTK